MFKFKNLIIKGSRGVEVYKWGNFRYKFIITIKNKDTNNEIRFAFFDSVNNYYKNKTRLDKEGLKAAFECFLLDCQAAFLDYEDFINEFGYTNNKEAKKVYQACQLQLERARKLGLDEDLIIDYINSLNQ